MKVQLFYLLGLLFLLSVSSCDKEEIKRDDTFFLEIENEAVTEELVSTPAYVWYEIRDITIVCYSHYAHEYGERLLENDWDRNDEAYNTICKDLVTHLVGIPTADYEKYQIGLNKNIFITASITNNNRIRPINTEECSETGGLCPYTLIFAYDIYKAYLKDVKRFN